MHSFVLNGEPISVSMASLVVHCRLFQTKPGLLSKPYRVESSASLDSLRVFIGAMPEISDANVQNLSPICDEFKCIQLGKTIGDWQAEQPLIN